MFNNKTFKKYFAKAFRFIGRKTPRIKNLVIFESFHGKRYSDSPRAIYEYMKEHNPEYKLIWSVDKDSIPLFEEMGVPYMKRFTLKWLFTFPTRTILGKQCTISKMDDSSKRYRIRSNLAWYTT